MVWDPKRIAPGPWSTVLAFYRGVEDRNKDFRPLRELVEHVMARQLGSPQDPSNAPARPLYGATSGTSLLVALRPDGEWTRNALRVDVGLSGEIRFVQHHPQRPAPVVFTCEPPSITAVFDKFLLREKWLGAGAPGSIG